MNKKDCINWENPVLSGISCKGIQKSGIVMECETCPSYKKDES